MSSLVSPFSMVNYHFVRGLCLIHSTAVFKHLDCQVVWFKNEGDTISPADARAKAPVACVTGSVRNILLGERTALNILTRASGVASEVRNIDISDDKSPFVRCASRHDQLCPKFGLLAGMGK